MHSCHGYCSVLVYAFHILFHPRCSYHHGLVCVQASVNRKTHVNRSHRLYQFAFHLGQQWLRSINPGDITKRRVSCLKLIVYYAVLSEKANTNL